MNKHRTSRHSGCGNGYFSANGGAALLEFAIILPILLLVSIPITDYFLFSLQKQKTNRAAITYADMVSMSLPVTNDLDSDELATNPSYLTRNRLNEMTEIYDQMMQPFVRERFTDEDNADHVIVSSIYRPVATVAMPDPDPVIMWQYWRSRGGNTGRDTFFSSLAPAHTEDMPDGATASSIGNVGDAPNLPQDFMDAMYEGENLIVVEVVTYYWPVIPDFSPFLPGRELRATKLYPARYGALCRVAKNGDGQEPMGCP